MIDLENNVDTFDTSPAFQAISRVTLIVGTDNNGAEQVYTAGTDTGRTLEAKCPWATQAIANTVLSAVKGYIYNPYTATGALLDPAAELGDGVTVCGVASQLLDLDLTFDALYTADIGAPQDEEVDHEYPFVSNEVREQRRQAATITAALKIGLDGITAEVANAGTWDESGVTIDYYGFGAPQLPVSGNNGKTYLDKSSGYVYTCNGTSWIIGQSPLPNVSASLSSLKVGLDGITAKVTDGSGNYTVLNLKSDGLHVGDGTSTVTIDGSSITANSIEADQIKAGTITFGKLDSSTQNAINDASDDASEALSDLSSLKTNIGYTRISGQYVISPNIVGSTITGGIFKATGQGSSAVSDSAYYIYKTEGSGSSAIQTLIGYLSYNHQDDPQDGSAADRVFLTSLSNAALKLQSAGDMSIQTAGKLHMMTPLYLQGAMQIKRGSDGLYGTINERPAASQENLGRLFFVIPS